MVPQAESMAESMKDKPLVIAGMHRSGTSMASEVLHASGVNLGERLMPAKEGNNSRGFFENLDFVELHERILQSQGVVRFGWTTDSRVSMPAQEYSRAREVGDRNQKDGLWGWKDPRTTLFLDFWKEQYPQALFIFLYRPPWEVVDSLYRRGDDIFVDNPSLAVDIWNHYNNLCLQFAEKHPAHSLFVSSSAVAANPSGFIDALNEKFSLDLSFSSDATVDPSLLQQVSEQSGLPILLRSLLPECAGIYDRLEAASAQLGATRSQVVSDPLEDQEKMKEIALRHWMDACRLKRSVRNLEKDLYQTRSELYDANEKVSFVERSRIWKLRNALDRFRCSISGVDSVSGPALTDSSASDRKEVGCASGTDCCDK